LVDIVDVDIAIDELQRYKRLGGRTLVDTTNIGLGRNPLALRQISSHTGVNIVMGCGYYKDGWLTPKIREMAVEELTEEIVKDIIDGVGNSGIHAGVIGEIGVSNPITSNEENVLKASARAQMETGAAITVHFDIIKDLNDYTYALNILEHEGADMSRVIVEHLVSNPNWVKLCKAIAERGCYLEFDLWGMDVWPKVIEEFMDNTPLEVQIASFRWFIINGLLDRLLISQDIGSRVMQVVNGGYGYAQILRDLVPQFKSYGIEDTGIETIMVDNPRKIFPLKF
jgi:phosphotriesterase-related protein